MALVTVRVMCHLMEPVTLLHTQPLLTVLMDLAEEWAVAWAWAEEWAWDGAEDLAEAEEWEEDGGKLGNEVLRAVLEYLPGLLS